MIFKNIEYEIYTLWHKVTQIVTLTISSDNLGQDFTLNDKSSAFICLVIAPTDI